MRKRCIGAVCFFLFCLTAKAQVFGGNPAATRWKQINTDTVRVIFPQEMHTPAQRVAAIVHAYQQNEPHTIGGRIRKVSIVLQNQTLLSNGYVSLAPYRSEFYTTPPQNPFELGAVNWTDNLALHEYRHVQQYSNFNKGLSRLASFFLGEQGQLVANAASVPDWFFEGDAVYNETKYTLQGRGALPFFFNGYRSLLLSNRSYGYMKLRNGSLRNYVPDHYNLGYLLVAYGRKQYGEDIWEKVTDDAVRFKPLVYPFQGAWKKHASVPFGKFITQALQFYKDQWQATDTTKATWLTKTEANNVVDYAYPYAAGEGKWVVLKSSRRSVPAFYMVSGDGSEKKIALRSISLDPYFSYNNGRIVYAAYQPDARWGNRAFQSIRQLDITTGKEKMIVSGTRFFSPDISHDGKQVLAVDMETSGTSRLVLMNGEGVVSKTISQPGIVFSHPKFSADDASVYVAARNVSGEMSLLKYSLADGGVQDTLVYASNKLIGFPTVQGDVILFTVTSEGRDEIWAVRDIKDKAGPFRMVSFATGLYQAVLQSNGQLLASVFTAEGYRLGYFSPRWERVVQKDELTDLYTGKLFPADAHQFLSALTTRAYAETRYPKSWGLFNFHSFRPYYEQPEYSVTFFGQNVLNTFQSDIAYTYNQNEKSHKLGYNGIYGGSYLQPVFGLSHTWQRSGALNGDTTVHWNELEWYAGLQLPLNFSGGKQYRFLTFSTTYRGDKISWTGIGQKLFTNRDFQYLQTRVSYSSQVQKAVQQIYPHFGQGIFLQYKNSVNNYTAYQFLAAGTIYLPGLDANHSVVVTGAWHSRDTLQQYLFSNNFPFARGYFAVDFPRMWKIGLNYHLPLAYPDWGFGQLVYFLRVRSNLFFDYAEARSLRTGNVYPFRSLGTELFFDTRWWNQQPVTFGFRYTRLLDNEFRRLTRPDVWEFVLPVNLFR